MFKVFTTVFQHPRTSIMGVVAIVTVVGKIAASGHIDLATDYAAIAAGIGLIFAHDGQ